jgi:hypothetical protein
MLIIMKIIKYSIEFKNIDLKSLQYKFIIIKLTKLNISLLFK